MRYPRALKQIAKQRSGGNGDGGFRPQKSECGDMVAHRGGEEGKIYAVHGSPEVRLFLAIPQEGITKDELQEKFDASEFKIACAKAAKNRWVDLGKQLVTRKIQLVDNDKVQTLLLQIQDARENISQDDIKALAKRKLIVLQVKKGFSVSQLEEVPIMLSNSEI